MWGVSWYSDTPRHTSSRQKHRHSESHSSSDSRHRRPPQTDEYSPTNSHPHQFSRSAEHRSSKSRSKQPSRNVEFSLGNSWPRPPSRSAKSNNSFEAGTPVTTPVIPTPISMSSSRKSKRERVLFYEKNAPYYEFTNFSPHDVVYKGKRYPTSEHLFQALKFLDDYPEIAERIRKCGERPMLAFDEAHRWQKWVRPDWRQVHVEKMEIVLYHKFTRHLSLKALLLDTGDAELIEDSPRDYFWGVGADHSGRNELGKALMRLRTGLREERNNPYKVPSTQKDTARLAAQDLTSHAPARPISSVNQPHLEERGNPSSISTSRKRSASLSSVDRPSHLPTQPFSNVNGPRFEERDNFHKTPTSRKRTTSLDVPYSSSVMGIQTVSRASGSHSGEGNNPIRIYASRKDPANHSTPDLRSHGRTRSFSNVNKPSFSHSLVSGGGLTSPQATSSQGNGLCEFCQKRPKFQNHPYCGRTCANEAKMCSFCHSKPRLGTHQYCSRTCATNASEAQRGRFMSH